MKKIEIHQIHYSNSTREQCDPGFLLLDNTENPRPDWREYWPIREFLRSRDLVPNTLYGFLSPKFKGKTHLASEKVFEFIENHDADVYLFSPFFDHSAYYINVFEQASANHPGILPTLQEAFALFPGGEDINQLVMSSRDTVFSNFLVARPAFWEVWHEYCERVFEIAESQDGPLAAALNADAPYVTEDAPAKVFVIERVASFLLSEGNWRVKAFNPMELGYGDSFAANFKAELCILDALKIGFQETGAREYLDRFLEVRNRILNVSQRERDEAIRERDAARAELTMVRHEHHAVLNTLSWRITRPLRGFVRVLRGIKMPR